MDHSKWRPSRGGGGYQISSRLGPENEQDAFSVVSKTKEEKYDDLAKGFDSKGLRAKVEAIIVCSLGAWDPENDRTFLKRLCSGKYLKMIIHM